MNFPQATLLILGMTSLLAQPLHAQVPREVLALYYGWDVNPQVSNIRTASDPYNVKYYGATGNGSTDDTTAIKAAITAAGCGSLYLPKPSVTYLISSTLVIPRCLSVRGDSEISTTITSTGTTAAFDVADNQGPTLYPRGAMHDLRIIGPATSGASIGILLGGDPATTGGGCPTTTAGLGCATWYGDQYSFYNVMVENFRYGVKLGNNAWLNAFFDPGIFSNGTGFYTPGPSVLTNSGENISFHGGAIANNHGALQLDADGLWLHFFGVSFDYNTRPIIGQRLRAEFFGCHFEGPVPFIDNSANAGTSEIKVIGGEAVLASSKGNFDSYFKVGHCGSGCDATFILNGTRFISGGGTVTQLVDYTVSGPNNPGVLSIENVQGYYGLSYTTPLTNTISSTVQDITFLNNWDQPYNVFKPGTMLTEVKTSGSSPSCTVTGAGSTGNCSFATGSNDNAGILIVTPGGNGIASSGSITLTFANTAFGINGSVCSWTLTNASGTWNARATAIETRSGASSNAINWDNNSVAPTTGDNYDAAYVCLGR